MWFSKKAPSNSNGPLNFEKAGIFMYTQSKKGSIFRTILRKGYDFQINYDEGPALILDKELVGYTSDDVLRVHLELDENYKVISSEINGGKFLTPQEYEELLKKEELK